MRLVLQRVSKAKVTCQERLLGKIERGLAILLGIKEGDTAKEASYLAKKVANLRIFENREGRFDLSLLDIGAEVLVVPNFTLYGDCKKGRRPDFTMAASTDLAKELYLFFIEELRKEGISCAAGEFGARMEIELINDGPVTLVLEA